MRFKNLFFLLFTSLPMLTITVLVVANAISDTNEETKSLLENRAYQKAPSLSIDEVLTCSFQANYNNFISDAIPYRDDIMLANAHLQRTAIGTACFPFGFEVCPTFFGSSRVIDNTQGIVYRTPSTEQEYSEEFFDRVSSFCNSIREGFDSIRFAYYVPASSNVSEANPAFNLVNEAVGYARACTMLDEKEPGITLLKQPFIDTDDYYSQMFHTDHHFQIQGSIVAYQVICEAFNKHPVELGDPYIAYNGGFAGSNARAGLVDNLSDVVYDVHYTPSDIRIWFDGDEKTWANVDKQFREEPLSPFPIFTNVYTNWFHSPKKVIEYENDDLDDSAGSLLIIGDSYINSGDRFYAENWKHVYIIDPRFYDSVSEIRSFINNHPDINQSAIMLSLTTYSQIKYLSQ